MFTFDNSSAHKFQPGMIYLGRDPVLGFDVGMFTEKGAITCADSRTGKGAAQIIPNIMQWAGNLLVIDPSGENVTATWEDLERRGYTVRLLDPFKWAKKVPARLRSSCNLLAGLDPDSPTIREDIRVITDGTVMRYDAKHGAWDAKRVELIAGIIAHVISTSPPEYRTLPAVNMLLNMTARPSVKGAVSPLEALFVEMSENHACRGLAHTGGETGLASMSAEGGQGPTAAAIQDARSELDWINSMESILDGSTFDLAELKTGKVAVFLVLPERFLEEHGRFLRLFVTAAINAMQIGGKVDERNDNGKLNRPCLFLLDEFPTLGNLVCIKRAAGALPKYGVHLWPFVQGPGQITDLYGEQGAREFFGNADAHCFFGSADHETMKLISERIGVYTLKTLPPPLETLPYPDAPEPVKLTKMEKWFGIETWQLDRTDKRVEEHDKAERKWEFDHRYALAINGARIDSTRDRDSKLMGTPLLSPADLAKIIGKGDDDKLARSMIVFGKAGAVFNLTLGPYFDNAGAAGAAEARRALTSSKL